MSNHAIITTPGIIEELRNIYKEKRGLLHPADVVEAAKKKDSALHSHFEWDDDKAAKKWRLEQARSLLRNVYVKIVTPDGEKMSQVFVSLTSDRESGGYRTMVDVLSDTDMRNQLIRDALSEMQLFTEKYNSIKELSSVFSAMGKVKKKLSVKVETKQKAFDEVSFLRQINA